MQNYLDFSVIRRDMVHSFAYYMDSATNVASLLVAYHYRFGQVSTVNVRVSYKIIRMPQEMIS